MAKSITYKDDVFFSGQLISTTISGIHLPLAHLHIDEYGRLFICHDNPNFNGSSCDDKHGHIYSWSFSIRNSDLTDSVTSLSKSYTLNPKDVIMSPNLSSFLNKVDAKNLDILFLYEIGIFNEFSIYDISDQEGHILLASKKSNKKISIKFGRLIKQLSTKIIESGIDYQKFSEKDIEDIHNQWTSHQKLGTFATSLLSGEDILSAYTYENYLNGQIDKENGTILHKSCMTNKFNYLPLYTKNPNQVSLLVLKFNEKVVSRALVWTAMDGKRYIDRIYHIKDWMYNYMKSEAENMGIIIINSNINSVEVKLDKWKFTRYPYLDSLYNMDNERGILHYYSGLEHRPSNWNKDMKTLRSTCGEPFIYESDEV